MVRKVDPWDPCLKEVKWVTIGLSESGWVPNCLEQALSINYTIPYKEIYCFPRVSNSVNNMQDGDGNQRGYHIFSNLAMSLII